MMDLNTRFRSFATRMKDETERSAHHQALFAEEKARLPEIIREMEERLKAVKAAGMDKRRELEAYIRLAKPCVHIPRPGAAVRPDMDLLQEIYLRMNRIPGDPEARRLYELASGGLAWLDSEEAQLNREIAEKRRKLSGSGNRASWPEAVEKQKQILKGEDFSSLLCDIQAEYARSVPSALLGGSWKPPDADAGVPPFAIAWKKANLLPECLPDFIRTVGVYGTKDGRMAVPQAFPSVLEIYPDNASRTESILKSLQAWAVHFITRNKPMPNRLFWIDAAMMSRASLGVLAPLERSSVAGFPETPADISNQLAHLLILQQEGKLSGRLLIARGIQEIISGQSAQILMQLAANSGNSGLRIVILHPEQFTSGQNSYDAIVCSKGTVWYIQGGKRSECTLPAPISAIPDDAVRLLKRLAVPEKVSSRFTDYIKTDVLPVRQLRADFPVTLSYGLLNGRTQTVSFWNMDFAGYLLGSAGSGKSTLLHTLIAGITSAYHPDDVELWLADMQNSSFSVYARHMPPHVRYLVLDHSVDAITAFIERIYQEHERRNALRAAAGVESIWDLPRNDVPPRVFVIVDEFGPLSDSLADFNSEKGLKCRTWLTFLLQQGRKNGFHFLFAHQNYVNGVRGLPDEAKNQIGLRLLMAADPSEKRACAAIANRTQEQDGILNGILPHYMAVRSHGQGLPEDRCMTLPAQVLFLDDTDMEKLAHVADRQRKEMRYSPKDPVVVDQSRRITFVERKDAMLTDLRQKREQGLVLYPGTPRNMDTVQGVAALRRTKQSFILLCDVHGSAERLQAALEVFRAALNSARMQKTAVEIWSCPGSPLSECLAERYGARPGFHPPDRVPDRIKQVFDRLQRREEIRQLILIPDLPQLMAQISDAEEEDRLLGRAKPGTPAPAPAGADPALADLVNAFRAAAPAQAQPIGDGPSLTEKLTAAIQVGPRYSTVFLACADKDTSVFPKPLKPEWFSNRMLFRSGAADFDTVKLARTLQDDQTFLYIGASDRILFTTYSFPE